jgi:hypothetical protein
MRSLVISFAVLLVLLPSRPLTAENFLMGAGARFGATVDPDQGHAGLHLEFAQLAERVRFQPNVEVGVGSGLTLVAFNPEIVVLFLSHGRWTPYAGGGLGLNLISHEEKYFPGEEYELEVGLNLLGGYETKVNDRLKLFVEGKYGVGDIPDFKISVGFTVLR